MYLSPSRRSWPACNGLVTDVIMSEGKQELPNQLLKPADVASELKVSLWTVYALIRSGDLRAVNIAPNNKPGTNAFWRIPRQCLNEFLTSRLTPGKSSSALSTKRGRGRPRTNLPNCPNYLRI